MTPTKGKVPRTDGPFMVQFRSGVVSGPYKPNQIRWTDEGSDWCVVAAELANENSTPKMARPENGSYQ